MSYFRPYTKRGYNLFEVASCLQKAIRRADTALAGYFATEMFESGYGLYAWKRLLTVSAEDCAGIITQEIKALFDSWQIASNNGEKRTRVFMSKAVIVLCAALKNRDGDHLANFVYDRQMIDAERLNAAIDEARANPENIPLPNYTFDVHTRRGRKKGKTRRDFFRDEQAALTPLQPGLFDHMVEQGTQEDPEGGRR